MSIFQRFFTAKSKQANDMTTDTSKISHNTESIHNDTKVDNMTVAELFTSQGCSSCPPADSVASRLLKDDPNVLVLSYHVDYWDYLGWKDPHSSAMATQRQRAYANRLQERGCYTPQIIINGSHGMVGSNYSKVAKEIQSARINSSGATVMIETNIIEAEHKLVVRVSRSSHHADVQDRSLQSADVLMITHVNGIVTNHVPRGENANSTCESVNAVISIISIGSWHAVSNSEVEYVVDIADKVLQGKERIVVMVQATNCGPILAAKKV